MQCLCANEQLYSDLHGEKKGTLIWRVADRTTNYACVLISADEL